MGRDSDPKVVLAKLNSDTYEELSEGLWDIIAKKPSTNDDPFHITPAIRARLKELFSYEYPDQSDPDAKEWTENIRKHAITILGLFFADESSFDDILHLLDDEVFSDFVLEGVIGSLAVYLGRPANKKKAMKALASVALDPKYNVESRNDAYEALLSTTRKFKVGDPSMNAEAGKLMSMDVSWLKEIRDQKD